MPATLGLPGDQFRLYTLIYQRFVASQMAPGGLRGHDGRSHRRARRCSGPAAAVLKFDGYRKVLAPVGKQDDVTLPPVTEGDAMDRLDLFASQHFTQPPPRFNEASLVKALEKEGIGRPSTYASIIGTIQKRGYVTQDAAGSSPPRSARS